MKLLLVTPQYAPHFEGGTEVVVRAQARELAARGHTLAILSGTDRPHAGEDVWRTEVDGLPVAHLPRLASEGYDLALARERLARLVEQECRAFSPDWVHLHHWSTLASDLVRRLSPSAPVAVTLHDAFTTCARFFRVPPRERIVCPEPGDFEACLECLAPDAGGLDPALLRAGLEARREAYRAELGAARLAIAPSRAHARLVEAQLALAPGSLEVLGHGLCQALEPAPGRHAWDGQGALRILHFGNRTRSKGTLDLARAVALLEPGRATLVCLGEAVEAGLDAELSALLGPDALELHGAYDSAALERAAAGAHLAAFPSRCHESYGLVVDEALALGLPVFASDAGALGERVGASGRVLPAADPPAWSRALGALLEEPARLAALRPRANELPTAAAAALRLEELFRERS